MKRWIPIAAGIAVVIGVGALLLLIIGRDRASTVEVAPGRYLSRELLIPDASFLIDSVEEELLYPPIRSLVDPDEPLDRDLVEDIQLDVVESLRSELLSRSEEGVEELLFDE